MVWLKCCIKAVAIALLGRISDRANRFWDSQEDLVSKENPPAALFCLPPPPTDVAHITAALPASAFVCRRIVCRGFRGGFSAGPGSVRGRG